MVSVKSFHTFGLNAQVAKVVDINSVKQLTDYVGQTLGKDFILLGEGSNVVFLSDFFKPLLIMKLKGIEVKEHEETYEIEVQAGENWHEFVQHCLSNNIYGLENLALIPGSVGACPVQNIGAYGVEINKFISNVNYFDLVSGQHKTLSNTDCEFSYRNSIFKTELKHTAVITSVEFRIPKSWEPVVSYGELAELEEISAINIFNKVIEIRKSKLPDPSQVGNSGSFFKNPIISNEKVRELKKAFPNIPVYHWSESQSKLAAGWLIDQAGLKGYAHKTVAVHEKQALVLINRDGNALSADLVHLISQIKDNVLEVFGVELEPEVRLYTQNGEVNFTEVKECKLDVK